METRKLKSIKMEIVPGPSFEEVTVKEEPDDVLNESIEFLEEEQATASKKRKAEKRTKAASITNTEAENEALPKTVKQRKIKPITNRATQVNSEEIDAWSFRKSYEDSVPGENRPIQMIGTEPIEPQCRFCLKRLSLENLQVISNEHKSKAMVAFHLKVFPRDAYPYACTNCLNLMDIFVDFKSIVTKTKKVLLTKRMHLQSDGWDDPTITKAFQKCKEAVESHRMQIDAVYNECFESTQQEPKQTADLDNNCNAQVDDNLQNSEDDGVEVLYTIEVDQSEHLPNEEIIEDGKPPNTVELEWDQIEPLPNEEGTGDDERMRDEWIPEEVSEERDESNSPTLQSIEEDHSSSNEKPDHNLPSSSQQGSSQSKKVKPVLDHDIAYLPAGLKVLCDICGQSMYSESLESHKNRHLGIKPYTCPVTACGDKFYSRANMVTHMRRMHTKKGRESHKCDICGKVVSGQLGNLNVHKKRHTNERKYVCDICGKGFTMTSYLRQHKLSHSAEYPHQCKYCGKKFNIVYSMRTHVKTIHEKNNHVPQS